MIVALVVFLFVAGGVLAVFYAVTHLPEARARKALELRLQEVSRPDDPPDQKLVMQHGAVRCPASTSFSDGPAPARA